MGFGSFVGDTFSKVTGADKAADASKKASKKTLKYQKRLNKLELRWKTRQIDKARDDTLAAIEARYAEGGVDLTKGSPLAVAADQRNEFYLQKNYERRRTKVLNKNAAITSKVQGDIADAQAQAQGMGTAVSIAAIVASAASDIRLKTDIELVGQTAGGIPLYEWTYIWGGGRHRGVMAHDVPWARFMHESGFWFVDYSRVH